MLVKAQTTTHHAESCLATLNVQLRFRLEVYVTRRMFSGANIFFSEWKRNMAVVTPVRNE